MNHDPIIFGKSDIKHIVNAEVINDVIELYRELPDGSIDVQYQPNKFWLLSPYPLQDKSVKLKGNLHYKYGRQFSDREDFLKTRGFLRQKDTFSIYNQVEANFLKDGHTYYKDLQIKDVSVLSFDIETTGFLNQGNKLLLISNTYRKKDKIIKKLFAFDEYANEGEMLQDWCKWVREMNPSIMLGHNVFSFDLPFLQEIGDKFGVSLNLGRDSSPLWFDDYESKFRKDGSQFYNYHKGHIFGREIIDTFFLSIKYDIATKKYTNYKLKTIIKEEGLEKSNRVFYDASKIKDNYLISSEWEKIKDYCRDDSDDSLQLFDLMAPSFFYLTQSIPKRFQEIICGASGSQLNSLLVRSYLQTGHSIPKADEIPHFPGGLSMGNPGIYKNVFKIDVASLYPSIMLQYEVFDKFKDPNANFLYMVKIFTKERLLNKKLAKETGNQYYKDLEQSQKIGINSAYGLLGANGLNFNSVKNAELVTGKGREILQTAIKWATGNEYTEKDESI